jgi:hypothetical protein
MDLWGRRSLAVHFHSILRFRDRAVRSGCFIREQRRSHVMAQLGIHFRDWSSEPPRREETATPALRFALAGGLMIRTDAFDQSSCAGQGDESSV